MAIAAPPGWGALAEPRESELKKKRGSERKQFAFGPGKSIPAAWLSLRCPENEGRKQLDEDSHYKCVQSLSPGGSGLRGGICLCIR